jgi:hypothetical protein
MVMILWEECEPREVMKAFTSVNQAVKHFVEVISPVVLPDHRFRYKQAVLNAAHIDFGSTNVDHAGT